MAVGWLVDASVFDYYEELVSAIVRQGHTAKVVNRPSPPYSWEDIIDSYRKAFPRDACVVTHADIELVGRVQAETDWTPGVFATVAHFHCVHYYSYLGRFLLNRDYVLLPFAELHRCSEFLFDTFGRDGKIFVRPDSPLKLFTGLVVSRSTLARDLEFMAFYDFPAESLVVVSSPKEIVAEWRFVIANDSVVAGSQYKAGDSMAVTSQVDPRAREFADEVLSTGFAPDPVWVMDVGRTEGGDYGLVEVGGFSFSNLYGCNKDAIVHAVSNVAAQLHAEQRRPNR